MLAHRARKSSGAHASPARGPSRHLAGGKWLRSSALLAAFALSLAPCELPAQQGAKQPAELPRLPHPRSVAAQLVKGLVVRAQQCEDRQEFTEAAKLRSRAGL